MDIINRITEAYTSGYPSNAFKSVEDELTTMTSQDLKEFHNKLLQDFAAARLSARVHKLTVTFVPALVGQLTHTLNVAYNDTVKNLWIMLNSSAPSLLNDFKIYQRATAFDEYKTAVRGGDLLELDLDQLLGVLIDTHVSLEVHPTTHSKWTPFHSGVVAVSEKKTHPSVDATAGANSLGKSVTHQDHDDHDHDHDDDADMLWSPSHNVPETDQYFRGYNVDFNATFEQASRRNFNSTVETNDQIDEELSLLA